MSNRSDSPRSGDGRENSFFFFHQTTRKSESRHAYLRDLPPLNIFGCIVYNGLNLTTAARTLETVHRDSTSWKCTVLEHGFAAGACHWSIVFRLVNRTVKVLKTFKTAVQSVQIWFEIPRFAIIVFDFLFATITVVIKQTST